MNAVAIPVIALSPGPDVTKTTPTFPALVYPSAAWVALAHV